MPVGRERLLLTACLLIAAGVFVGGITWGLPSGAGDPYLFGGRPALTGIKLVQTEAALPPTKWDDPARGADVDADPLVRSDRPVVLNADVTGRAAIVRRYRLFSHQPDEMITFMALAKMRPGQRDFDPRLYQYGGLWVYPVGLFLKAAATLRYVDLQGGSGGLAHYMDHPEAFGRFYVVARVYVALWGLVGVWAVFAIVRRITGRPWAAAGAALVFVTMPVVVNMAHEAKPHLPGVVLVLLAVIGGARYVETGKLGYAVAAGTLCGLALGMVLSTLPAFSILPAMVLLRPMGWGERARVAVFCGLLGLAAYGLTNPYVVYHALAGGEALKSNLENSRAFYGVDHIGEGFANVARLMFEGASPGVFTAGLIVALALAVRAGRRMSDSSPDEVRRRAHGVLLALPALLTVVQWVPLAAGKPGEFGRFLLLPDVFLAVEVFAVAGTLPDRRWLARAAGGVGAAVVLLSALAGWPYLRGFVRDAGAETSRLAAAREVEALRQAGGKRLLLAAEPAPYAVPPANVFDWPVVLVPKGSRPEAFAEAGDVIVEVGEGDTPISWADKPFRVVGVK